MCGPCAWAGRPTGRTLGLLVRASGVVGAGGQWTVMRAIPRACAAVKSRMIW